MGDRDMWKMTHLLYLYGKPCVPGSALDKAGIDCYPDTILPLIQDEVVQINGSDYSLSRAAAGLLRTCVLANSLSASIDVRVDYPSAFVAMPFSLPWSTAVFDQLIEPAVRDSGLECLRGDTIVRVGDLTSNIWREILRAGVIVADISAPNVNVFYELGLTHALGKDTLLLKERTAALPADFGGAHYIEYDLQDLPSGKLQLESALIEWSNFRSAAGVKELASYG